MRLAPIAVFAFSFCLLRPAQEAAAQAASTSPAALPDAPAPQPSAVDRVTIRGTPLNLLRDQEALWTSPAHARARDLQWLLPLTAAAGVAFATDRHTMTQVVSRDPAFNQASVDASNALIGCWIAVPVAVYGFGRARGDGHASETGILAGESMVDGFVVDELLKQLFRRERPNADNGHGDFFQSNVGADSSFPSTHSVIAWSAASALAAEYPARWAQFTLYSAATGVSLTRVMGQQHFPSDVLVGSSLGWLIGHNVVKRHHHKSSELSMVQK